MKTCLSFASPVGLLTAVEEDGALIRLCFGTYDGEAVHAETPLLLQTVQELNEYFCGERRIFTLPLRPQGTPFQLRCWQALREIPWGETRTYAQQAQAIGQPKACRAVGMGNHRNPLPILIPCHRVIGKSGALTGYAGGLAVKERLLQMEQQKG